MSGVAKENLAPRYLPPPTWPGKFVMPLKVARATEVDARQGADSGHPAWAVEDAKGSHICGLFLDPQVAECWRISSLVMNVTDGRTGEVDQLTPREAYQLIEMLKSIRKREDRPGLRETHVAVEAQEVPF